MSDNNNCLLFLKQHDRMNTKPTDTNTQLLFCCTYTICYYLQQCQTYTFKSCPGTFIICHLVAPLGMFAPPTIQ